MPFPLDIPFNRPYLTGNELAYINDACQSGHLSGCGKYTELCETWLQLHFGAQRVLLTHSCTAALEMCALILDLSDDDEIIMPSYTFVSTANAFKLRNVNIKFVDISEETLCLDPALIIQAINKKTKAVVVVSYAGRNPHIEQISQICKAYNLVLIEDNAQGLGSTYNGQPLGSYGAMSCLSFHETKNISCGEGGALIINDANLIEKAEWIREKGTNRSAFGRGEVDKYTWLSLGSSYVPSELNASYLWAQLQSFESITAIRHDAWYGYLNGLTGLAKRGSFKLPLHPNKEEYINGHIFYLLFPHSQARDSFNRKMNLKNINCIFHYIPLHSSPFNILNVSSANDLPITDNISSCLTRLPMWVGIDKYQAYITEAIHAVFN